VITARCVFVFVIVLFVILLGLLSDMLFVYCIVGFVAFQPLVANYKYLILS